jgi:hypothetical protein
MTPVLHFTDEPSMYPRIRAWRGEQSIGLLVKPNTHGSRDVAACMNLQAEALLNGWYTLDDLVQIVERMREIPKDVCE